MNQVVATNLSSKTASHYSINLMLGVRNVLKRTLFCFRLLSGLWQMVFLSHLFPIRHRGTILQSYFSF